MNKLSVIVPCLNCEGTLEEAVESIFRQKVPIPFDVTLVDDGSTDETYELMQKLAAEYPGIRLVQHKTNRGGGAARNTAVENCDGNIIYCLDSDDILGDNCLENLTAFWLEKKCDGVGISTSIKFNNADMNDISHIDEFESPGKKVKLESFLDENSCSLNSTFLITREAFQLVGGYPTDHGFDTQGMAFRFLCHGLTAYTCPETVYYHRINYHDSYYIREDKAGRTNWNWFQIFDEFLYIFNDKTKSQLLQTPLFGAQGAPRPPEMHAIVRGKKDIYVEYYKEFVALGIDAVANKFRDSEDKFSQYWLGGYYLSRNKYSNAIDCFSKALALGFDYQIIYIKILRASLLLAGQKQPVSTALTDLQTYWIPPEISAYTNLKNRIKQIRILRPLLNILFGVANWLRELGSMWKIDGGRSLKRSVSTLQHNYHELGSFERFIYWLFDRWRLSSKERFFFEGFLPLPGQLYVKDREALYKQIIAQKPSYCYEIGTWTGGGSTYFLASAFKKLGSGKLISLEADRDLHKKAVRAYQSDLPKHLPFVDFLNGSNPELFLPYIQQSGDQVDCVFLDGSDNPFETLEQFLFFRKFMRRGSVLMAHDWHTEKMQEVRPLLESDKRWHLELSLDEPESVGFVIYSYAPEENDGN